MLVTVSLDVPVQLSDFMVVACVTSLTRAALVMLFEADIGELRSNRVPSKTIDRTTADATILKAFVL